MPNCPNCGKEYNPGDEVCSDCGLVFPFTTDTLAQGTILQGRYEIQELAHSGGMGYIYLAKDKKLYDRLCIVKQVKEPVRSASDLKKLEEEAHRMAKLSHPNVAMILDHFVEDNHYFLVVERISGKTLSEVFEERHGQLSEDEVVSWAISMCDVISYIHKQDIIHRDISPDNVMLTDEGLIKFVDFGTLRELRYITTKGTAGMGKYGYTPPEQWQGRPVPESDIFALGATVYYLLTGNLPLSKEYLTGQGPQKQDFRPIFPPIRAKNPDISSELEAVLQKALQLGVDNRYPSAAEFGQELRNLATEPMPKREPSKRARPVLSVDTDCINFSEVKVGSLATRTLTIRNTGTGRLAGKITTTQAWLKASPDTINLEKEQGEIKVTVDTLGLGPGFNDSGDINIITNGGIEEVAVSLSTAEVGERVATTRPLTTQKLIAKPGKFWVGALLSLLGLGLACLWVQQVPFYYFGHPFFGNNLDFLFPLIPFFTVPFLLPGIYFMRKGIGPGTMVQPSANSTSKRWWLIPIFLGFIGGIVALRNLRDINRRKAVNLFTFGIIWTLILIYPFWILLTGTEPSSVDGKDPAWSPDGSKIAFVSDRDGNDEIYVMSADGSNQKRCTHSVAIGFNRKEKWEPVWSPDSKLIAFVQVRKWEREGEATYIPLRNVYALNADGSNATCLTDNSANSSQPVWSPNGRIIAFVSDRDGNDEIYVMNADGSNQTNLTNNPAGDASPSWSPDSTKIAFVSDRDGNDEIYIMNADGSNQKRFTSNDYDDYDPVWSPDGTRIAFVSWDRGSFDHYIWVIYSDGSRLRRLSYYSAYDVEPVWSPDGKKIFFTCYMEHSTHVASSSQIFGMNSDGSGRIRITNNDFMCGNPKLSPDGTRIAFEAVIDNRWNICVINTDGTSEIRLTNPKR